MAPFCLMALFAIYQVSGIILPTLNQVSKATCTTTSCSVFGGPCALVACGSGYTGMCNDTLAAEPNGYISCQCVRQNDTSIAAVRDISAGVIKTFFNPLCASRCLLCLKVGIQPVPYRYNETISCVCKDGLPVVEN